MTEDTKKDAQPRAAVNTVTLSIDGRTVTVPRCTTVLDAAKSLGLLKADVAIEDLRWLLTEDRPDRRVMFAAAWAIQEITGRTPHVALPKPRPGDWIIKDY